jgi:hypothetical protein
VPLWPIATAAVAFLIFSLSIGALAWWLVSREHGRVANVPSQPALNDTADDPAVAVDAVPLAIPLELGFVSLFNGRDLDAWEGDSSIWSVQDGVIRGTSKRKLGSGNWTCLFWQGKELQDFELRFSFRLQSGNSGVFFRSRQLENFSASGYQFDIFPGIVGNLLDIGRDRPKRELARPQRKATGWHEAAIIAAGNRIIHKLDGNILCDVTDTEESAPREGWIALELGGGPTTVEFKDIRLKQTNGDAAP